MSEQRQGKVLAIYISAEAGLLPISVEKVYAQAGRGLVGDRYGAGIGTWSNRPGGGRHLTLIAQEDLETMAQESGIRLSGVVSRRNVLTAGIDLKTLVGRQFWVGSARCVGVRLCDPCSYLEAKTQPGVLKALVGRGGLRAEIVEGGQIAVGDALRVVDGCSSA